VNVEFIASITAADVTAGDYRVRLRAALNGNLDLELADTTSGLADWKGAVAAIEPASDRLVLFARAPADPFVAEVLAAARARGVDAVVHPLDADKALRFGLGMKLTAGSPGATE